MSNPKAEDVGIEGARVGHPDMNHDCAPPICVTSHSHNQLIIMGNTITPCTSPFGEAKVKTTQVDSKARSSLDGLQA